MTAKPIIVGQRYGSWIVIALDDGQHPKRTLCRCDCGTERWVVNSTLRTGKSRSCGCKSYKEPPVYPIKADDRIGRCLSSGVQSFCADVIVVQSVL